MFSFVSCLSGLVVISIMFTNRVYILIKKAAGKRKRKNNILHLLIPVISVTW